MERNLIKNQKDRDQIIFGNEPQGYLGGVAHFDNLTADKLQELIDKKYADPEDAQNDAPTLGEMLEFMKQYPKFLAHGYAVEEARDDYRVSIEGLHSNGKKLTKKEMEAFTEAFHHADEFTINPARCWFD